MNERAKTPVGSLEWERAGGPPLSLSQRIAVLGGAAAVILADLPPRIDWHLGRWGLMPRRLPRKVDLVRWSPPDTRVVKDAEEFLREVSSPQMALHSLRTYYFSAILYELSNTKDSIDREALYVAAVLHDVGLFEDPRPFAEHCFSVGSAREARRIAKQGGWDDSRLDRMAVAITTNLNARVPIEHYGPEAHFMRAGGLVEVIAQEWRIHPDNLAEILARYPRTGFAEDALALVSRESILNPRGRFACMGPIFPVIVRRASFSLESRS